MKLFSAATAVASVVFLSNAYHHDAQRMLILGGDTVPASLRLTEDGNTYCDGALISPTHVLTASHCSVYRCRWVSIGSHYRNGTEDGECIKIVSMMNHPNYSENVQYSNDFMVVELERPSKLQPVKFAAADDSDFKAGKMATAMGWGTTAEENGTAPYELQRVNVPFASDEDCAAYATVDSGMVCAGGVANRDSCTGDSGGPLIIENEKGGDVLVGDSSWSKDDNYEREGFYGVFSRVSSVRAWIETITGGKGTCLP